MEKKTRNRPPAPVSKDKLRALSWSESAMECYSLKQDCRQCSLHTYGWAKDKPCLMYLTVEKIIENGRPFPEEPETVDRKSPDYSFASHYIARAYVYLGSLRVYYIPKYFASDSDALAYGLQSDAHQVWKALEYLGQNRPAYVRSSDGFIKHHRVELLWSNPTTKSK